MANPIIAIVDDDEKIHEGVRLSMGERYTFIDFYSGKDALGHLKEHSVDLMLLDIDLPDISGMSVLDEVKRLRGDTTVIMITVSTDPEMIVSTIKKGAYHYVTKPFKASTLSVIVEDALREHNLMRELNFLRSEVKNRYSSENIIGKSGRIQEIYTTIGRVAQTDSNILIQGESGTGKELIARAIHFQSKRADKPFVAVSCAYIPNELIANELFGHEKGAYTGAYSTKEGKFEQANMGTLFLDEIGEISPSVQVALLRVLEEHTITRLGGKELIPVDVRIIAATNADLAKLVREGRFREDLYYRLNVVPIYVPPLRERREDIPLLAQYFLDLYCSQMGSKPKRLSDDAMEWMMQYHWGGNVRELKNMIERAVVMDSDGIINLGDFLPERKPDLKGGGRTEAPEAVPAPPPKQEGRILTLEEMEKEYIDMVLRKNDWRKSFSAKLLGIPRSTLDRKIAKYGLTRP
ncbi:MAG: sigma-54-dependent transcriptional regulator [bacterium]